MPIEKTTNPVAPLDAQIGGDADLAGIAEPVTADDVQAILGSPRPIEERRRQLVDLQQQIQARAAADRGGDMTVLLAEIEGALASLTPLTPGEVASRAALGMDPEQRLDARPLDDQPERD